MKRQVVAAQITRTAQRLAEERGLDGFTMDDVAENAGMSRRTLFNYVPGKLDAVLGVLPERDPARFAEFISGGPSGRLGEDVKAVVTSMLESKDATAEDAERVRRLIATEPRLQKAMRDRFAKVAAFFADAIAAREGEGPDPVRAQASATVTLALLELALDAYAADAGTTLSEHYVRAFDGAAALFE